jgi:hypothetical protein
LIYGISTNKLVMFYPLVNVYKKLLTLTHLLIGKSTIYMDHFP